MSRIYVISQIPNGRIVALFLLDEIGAHQYCSFSRQARSIPNDVQ